jgi:hypothetical protein
MVNVTLTLFTVDMEVKSSRYGTAPSQAGPSDTLCDNFHPAWQKLATDTLYTRRVRAAVKYRTPTQIAVHRRQA